VGQTAQIRDIGSGPLKVADTRYTRRARYFDSENAFNINYPPVPGHSFVSERDQAFEPETGTALIPLDQSGAMGLSFPATTPMVLASYARVAAGGTLEHTACASTVCGYVIEGGGRSMQGDNVIEWYEGDVFCFPGGAPITHVSGNTDTVLWLVTNEPQLAFERFSPPEPNAALVECAHFPAQEIQRELEVADAKLNARPSAGLAVVLSTQGLEAIRNISPTLTLAMNQLRAGGAQPPHRHNSVAVSLVVKGPNCYSMIDGTRKNWEPWVTVVTPPECVHSHHNDGSDQANWLIVQDGGIHYHCRTMGFSYS